jgi:hypothetical protein
MIIAKRKINAVDSRAIIRSDIGARNRRNTGAIIRGDIGTRNRRNTGAIIRSDIGTRNRRNTEAITRSDIGTRNRRNTKTRRMLMIVDTIRTWTTLPSLHGYGIRRFFCTRLWAGRTSQRLPKAVGRLVKGTSGKEPQKCATQLSKAFF